MKPNTKDFTISFSGLKNGEHEFDFQITDQFFTDFEYSDFAKAKLDVKVHFEKFETKLDLRIRIKGKVKVQCDLSADWFWMPVDTRAELVVKFGDNLDDSNEDLWILPQDAHSIDLGQYFYEMAVLAKPLKVIHPEVESGKRGREVLEKLAELNPENQKRDSEEEIDPRWDKLKDLLN